MSPMPYADDLYAKFCKLTDVYNKSTLNKIFIVGVDLSICQRLREYWATHPQTDVTDTAFKAQSLLGIQKGATKPANTNNHDASNQTYGRRARNKPSAHSIEIGSWMSPTHSSQQDSRSPLVLDIHTPAAPHTRSNTSSSSSMSPSPAASTCQVCYNSSHSTLTYPILAHGELAALAAMREGRMKKKDTHDQPQYPPRPGSRFTKFRCFPNKQQQPSSSDQTC